MATETTKNTPLLYGIIGVVAGGLAVWLLMSMAIIPSSSRMMRSEGGMPAQYGMGNMGQIDAHFIEQMIPHHEDAITMARLALTKASHPEIKQLAEAIIDSQSREIDQMKDWYKEWYGRDLPTGDDVMRNHGMMSGSGMHMGMMGNESDTQRLETAADFDRAFIEHMIPHHQMAVMMASMLKQGTDRPEMRQLADDIITAQTREIEQMRQWYAAWY